MLRFVKSLVNGRRGRSCDPQTSQSGGGGDGVGREASSLPVVHVVVHISDDNSESQPHREDCGRTHAGTHLEEEEEPRVEASVAGHDGDDAKSSSSDDDHRASIHSQQVETVNGGGTGFLHSNEVATPALVQDSQGLSGNEITNRDVQAPESTGHITQPSTFEDRLKIEVTGHADKTFLRSLSTQSSESASECCRICQQPTDEALVELGCHCRGELAKAHRSCVEQWFNNKGSNKCEICQHVATNVPCPTSLPTQNFWVWRLGAAFRGPGSYLRRQGTARFHPVWAALMILIAGLLFDVLISISLGPSAVPVNIIIGVLIVLGLGTATRLIMECWQEHNRRGHSTMTADT